ncbi:1-deoxy-D-xylulose-5-phosphate reductoisomerase [Porticoccaceae bacterium]|jgi:1-deoxy-D-xylulose-5-phosphate reductoisomerase|nr:1-deoxy-D-xylulose-5-phosphate reductoisomerase [Porticoccaceae bacterium]MDA7768730.1 1-deoxy-D-xylulose-5-phosphate reductoisomerase [Porticoccaceae bacterium]MDA8598490.1 1-deoxy-D-xylulose-5-phosphate reductoisomerase [Porticoccaceae bacterium]MDA8879452.1 1-deoxy-D-xylulose-5-phosphate reductoisomerase [Porticoccaceae bacterium]
MKQITILGATGSIGISTLDVIDRHSRAYNIFALTGNKKIPLLAEQCAKFNPKYAVVMDAEAARELVNLLTQNHVSTEVLVGTDALASVSSHEDVDIVMAAIVGSAGLIPTLAAANAGKKVLLANKESLVMAGNLLMQAVDKSGATLLPIDSEHNAIFQCLPRDIKNLSKGGVSKLLLSASGGPFRGWSLGEMDEVTREQACAHPNWSMGKKISVDSATLMNKGLELIEACLLFDVTYDQIDIVVHPQSIIHSLVQYVDGSVLAQMGNPDMRTPIAHALAWPKRINSGVSDLNLAEIAKLDFEEPDLVNFPCLGLAYEAARVGLDAPVVLNASNEVAVQAFLDGRIGFTHIAQVVADTMARAIFKEPDSLSGVQESDKEARATSAEIILRVER